MPSADITDQYSSWVGLIYVYNLIVGTGALTLPAVFAKAGWALSISVIIMLAFMGFVTVTFVIETMACANATLQIRRIQSHKIDGESEVLATSDSDPDDATEETPVINNRSRYYTLNQRVELGEMTQLFFSTTGKLLFYLSLCIYLYGDLAIYTAAVSRTMTDLICDERMASNETLPCWAGHSLDQMGIYRVILVVFIVIVGPFSYFNLQKTKYLQIATSSMRWGAFLIMINIALVSIIKLGAQGAMPPARFADLPQLIGVCVYSFMCHHSLPGLIAPFSDKSQVIRQLGLDYALICLFYLLLAVSGAFAFKHLDELYTLNFIPVYNEHVGWVTKLVEYFLTLFPVFTLTTNFPIIAITLQNNLKTLFLDPTNMDRYNFAVKHLLFPTLAVIPPALVALATHNLDSLVSFTGTYAGATIQYLFPAFLVWHARKTCMNDMGSSVVNKYKSPFQGIFWIGFVVVWCMTCMGLSSVNLFYKDKL